MVRCTDPASTTPSTTVHHSPQHARSDEARLLTFQYRCFSCNEPSPRGVANLDFCTATILANSACCASMNYTGNPRHLRRSQHTRSSHKGLGFRHRQPTPTTRPWLDICGSFQKQKESAASGSNADNSVTQCTTSSSEEATHGFQNKRRRLLEQGDWLGLDIGAPINVLLLSCLEKQVVKSENRYTN